MTRPRTRLFHLHFNTPAVDELEAEFASLGVPLHRRFGWVDSEFTALDADDPVPAGWKLRLETLQTGYVNLTLAPGRRFHFDHLGLCTADFDAVVARADERGWSVRERDGRRPFVMTPWGFRVELHRDGDDVERELGDWEDARLDSVRLVVPEGGRDADADTGTDASVTDASETFAAVFGDVPGLTVVADDVDGATVPQFTLGGEQFPEGRVVETASLRSV